MRVNFSQETESGPVKFIGDLSETEVNFLVEYAIIDLVKRGMMPLSISESKESMAKFVRGSAELQ